MGVTRIQANVLVGDRHATAFRRYLKDNGWTISGWVRWKIIRTAKEQLEKEKANATTEG